jgi:hypothetical protein
LFEIGKKIGDIAQSKDLVQLAEEEHKKEE